MSQYNVVSFRTMGLYLQYVNIKANEIGKIAKRSFFFSKIFTHFHIFHFIPVAYFSLWFSSHHKYTHNERNYNKWTSGVHSVRSALTWALDQMSVMVKATFAAQFIYVINYEITLNMSVCFHFVLCVRFLWSLFHILNVMLFISWKRKRGWDIPYLSYRE